jgi:hypothetical protein
VVNVLITDDGLPPGTLSTWPSLVRLILSRLKAQAPPFPLATQINYHKNIFLIYNLRRMNPLTVPPTNSQGIRDLNDKAIR